MANNDNDNDNDIVYLEQERLRAKKSRERKKEAGSQLAFEHQQLVLVNQGLVSENEQLRELIRQQQATIAELQLQLLHSDNMAHAFMQV
jgi:hypothetical protein